MTKNTIVIFVVPIRWDGFSSPSAASFSEAVTGTLASKATKFLAFEPALLLEDENIAFDLLVAYSRRLRENSLQVNIVVLLCDSLEGACFPTSTEEGISKLCKHCFEHSFYLWWERHQRVWLRWRTNCLCHIKRSRTLVSFEWRSIHSTLIFLARSPPLLSAAPPNREISSPELCKLATMHIETFAKQRLLTGTVVLRRCRDLVTCAGPSLSSSISLTKSIASSLTRSVVCWIDLQGA